MKTINDLVDKLNRYGVYGEYYVRKRKAEEYLLYKRYTVGEDVAIFCFAKEYPYWSIYADLGSMRNKVQEEIMDFVYNTDKEHWFDEPAEKKYNIIIGEDTNREYKSAYQKVGSNGVEVCDSVDEDDLALEVFIFTESEIEDLKSKVSTQSAKIIDIAKVEVTNEV